MTKPIMHCDLNTCEKEIEGKAEQCYTCNTLFCSKACLIEHIKRFGYEDEKTIQELEDYCAEQQLSEQQREDQTASKQAAD